MRVARSDPRLLLALAWLAGFTLIDSNIVSLALPDIARAFDRPIGALAWVSTIYLLALAAMLLPAGRLNDRYGSRRTLGIGAAAFLLTTALAGVAPSFELLVLARFFQGLAGGILYTVSLAIAVTAFPPERRAGAIGIYFTSGALGAVIGPAVGGVLTDLGGWRLVFLAQLPLPLLVTVGAFALLPRHARVTTTAPIDLAGILAASVFIAAATLALLELALPGLLLAAVVTAAVAVVALAVFVRVERRTTAPAVPLSIFGNGRFVIGAVAGAGAWFAITSSTIYPALYLQLGRGLSATDAGLLLLASPIVSLLLFPFAGRIVAALSVDRALLVGLLLLVGSGAAMLAWGAATPLWFVVATNLVVGGGLAITLVASAADALSQFTPAEAGTGSALFNSIRQLGAATGVAVPAIAFELVAAGSRTAEASLAGSTAAFAVRLAFLVVPLALVVARLRPARADARAST
jgi:MFS family permease